MRDSLLEASAAAIISEKRGCAYDGTGAPASFLVNLIVSIVAGGHCELASVDFLYSGDWGRHEGVVDGWDRGAHRGHLQR